MKKGKWCIDVVAIKGIQFRERMLLEHSFFVASAIDDSDVANVFDLCGKAEERQGICPYRGVIKIFNWRLHEEYFHRREYSGKNRERIEKKVPMKMWIGVIYLK